MAEQPRDAKAAILDALLKNDETARWQPFFDILNLNEESWTNLLRLLVLHLLLENLLAARLSLRLVQKGMKVDEKIVRLNIPDRIKLAVELGAISEDIGRYIAEVNEVRNACVHHKPNLEGKFEAIPQIATKEAFEAYANMGIAAFNALLKPLPGPI